MSFVFSLLMFCVCPPGQTAMTSCTRSPAGQTSAHFNDALSAAQQRYRNSLPPAVSGAGANKRFAPQSVDQRAEAQLRKNLADPKPALAFFQSPLGRKIVAAELLATRRDQLGRTPRACRT